MELEEGDVRNDQPLDGDLRRGGGGGGVREHDNPLPNPLHGGGGGEEGRAHPLPLDEPVAAHGRQGHEVEDFDGPKMNDDDEDDYGGVANHDEEAKGRRVDSLNEDQVSRTQ